MSALAGTLRTYALSPFRYRGGVTIGFAGLGNVNDVYDDASCWLDNVRLLRKTASGWVNTNLVQNPSFEQPQVGSYTYLRNAGSTTDLPGWTIPGNDTGLETAGGPFAATVPDGRQAFFLQRASGALSQTLANLTPGTYKIVFTKGLRGSYQRQYLSLSFNGKQAQRYDPAPIGSNYADFESPLFLIY